MVKSCAAFGCTNRFESGKNVHFHRFPLENPELCAKWVVATRREKFIPTKYSHICSEHFLPTDYVCTTINVNDPKPRLRMNSVPSVFNIPERLLTKQPKRKPLKKRLIETQTDDDFTPIVPAPIAPPLSKK